MNVDDWQRNGKYYSFPGHQVFFQDAGAGEVLLCIHGFPTASWDWHRLWPDLIKRYRVIAPDLLGFGFSDKPTRHAYSLFEQATILEKLLDHLDIPAVHILAHDYGVTVAQELLARQLESSRQEGNNIVIHSVALLNGGLFPEATFPLFIQKALKNRLVGPLLARLLSERAFRHSFSRVFAPGNRPTRSELRAFWSLVAHNNGKRVAHRVSRYQDERRTHRERWTEAVQNTDVPVRLIIGSEDPVSGLTIARRFRELVRNPDVVIVDGAGHYPQVEAPERVLEALLAFLGGVKDSMAPIKD